jgi:streptogramin lyase
LPEPAQWQRRVGGPAIAAQLSFPAGSVPTPAGNLYIADYNNNRVVRVDGLTGILTLVAGAGTGGDTGDGGPASLAAVNGPLGLAMDSAGNLYISEFNANRIRKVDAQTGIISTVAAGIFSPVGLALDASRNLVLRRVRA